MRIETSASDMAALLKLAPLVGAAVRVGGSMAASAAKDKVAEKTKELAEARQEQAEAEKNPTEERPPEATAGSEITGLTGNANAGVPTEQPGTNAPPRVQVSKTFFIDNFGVDGEAIIKIMEENGEGDMVPRLLNLLKQEQDAILSDFDWWKTEDWGHISVRDHDFTMLAQHADRLELPFRKAVTASRRAKTNEEREMVWKEWGDRLSAESRLSRRERGILTKAAELIAEYGDMNVQTMTSHGLQGTSAEISSLIKSHGFLYDIHTVGKGRRADDRSFYYGCTKPPILLKTVDRFIANLWDMDGEIGMTPLNAPRLILPFESKRGADYADVLKHTLGVGNIMWEGQQFVIEGDRAVLKACEVALPHLTNAKPEADLLLRCVNGDEWAARFIAYQTAGTHTQVSLLKSWGVSEDELTRRGLNDGQ